MKRVICTAAAILSVSALMVCAGCSSEKGKTDDVSKRVLDSIREEPEGYRIEEATDNSGAAKRKVYYEKDRIAGYEEYSDGKVSSYQTYEYNEQGKKIAEYSYDARGKLESKVIYSYDESGNLSERTASDSEGNQLSVSKYEYDSNGNETKMSYYGEGNKLQYFTVSTYGSDKKLVSKRTYNGDNKETSREEWEYGEDGGSVQTIYTGSEQTFCVTYSANGVALRTEKYSGGVLITLTEKNENNKLIKETNYDKDGNVTSYSQPDENGVIVKYDSSGKKIG